MTTATHTQGPWGAELYLSGDCYQITYGTKGNWLAEVHIDGEMDQAKADAALIAAAPELLAVVRQMLDQCKPETGHSMPDALVGQALLAIAKATGA